MKIIDQLLSERAFNQLRTVEGLGYYVASSYSLTRRVSGVYIIVESAKYTAQHLEERIFSFLKTFVKDLDEKQEAMEDDIDGLIENLEAPYNKVEELSNQIWNEILLGS